MEDDNKGDELINVKLPRAQYELFRQMLKREEAFGWLRAQLSASWIWIVAGGILSLIALWDRIHGFLVKV